MDVFPDVLLIWAGTLTQTGGLAKQERRMRKILFAAVLFAGIGNMALADTLPPPNGTPCRTGRWATALDPWIGDWKVVNASDGSLAGTNLVEASLDGCAVTENWHGVDKGDDGMSLFTYDARRHVWDQVWVTQDTSRAGGLKHKTMIAFNYGNVPVFQGKIVSAKGTIIDRTSLTPYSDGRVRQKIEWSKDNGKTWQTVFDAFYIKKGANPDLGNSPSGDPH
jgi:hypothetical protein